MSKANRKSDVKAKQAYKKHLECNGYTNVEITGSPSDIRALKNEQVYYFEIKMTKQTNAYFGASTLTEWIQAFKTPDFFKFVIAKTDEHEETFAFTEFSPAEFMEHSTIPPFKIYFNISLTGVTLKRKRKTAIPLTFESMKLLTNLYEGFRK